MTSSLGFKMLVDIIWHCLHENDRELMKRRFARDKFDGAIARFSIFPGAILSFDFLRENLDENGRF